MAVLLTTKYLRPLLRINPLLAQKQHLFFTPVNALNILRKDIAFLHLSIGHPDELISISLEFEHQMVVEEVSKGNLIGFYYSEDLAVYLA